MTMVGRAIDRVDGPPKVTGGAAYSYEHFELGHPLHGFILGGDDRARTDYLYRHGDRGSVARRASRDDVSECAGARSAG
jgi:hypothetical protein